MFDITLKKLNLSRYLLKRFGMYVDIFNTLFGGFLVQTIQNYYDDLNEFL